MGKMEKYILIIAEERNFGKAKYLKESLSRIKKFTSYEIVFLGKKSVDTIGYYLSGENKQTILFIDNYNPPNEQGEMEDFMPIILDNKMKSKKDFISIALSDMEMKEEYVSMIGDMIDELE